MASSLISESSHASPLPSNLKHLKRVRPSQQSEHLDLILHATDEIKDGEALSMIDCLPESISALVRQHDLSPFLTKVPFLAPETREQWQEWGRAYWPMVWKIPEKTSTSAPPDLTDEEQAYFQTCMSQVLDHSSGLNNAAMIVDPVTFSLTTFKGDHQPWVIAIGMHSTDQHPLAHAVMEAVARASERDKKLWPISSLEEKKMAMNEEGLSSKRQKLETGDPDTTSYAGPRPYMCTGYDIFIKREPCIMCAMALVHSRLSRVIYCHSDLDHGALGGKTKLHAQRSLNHHYHVYQLSLKGKE